MNNKFLKARVFADNTVIALDNSDWPQFKNILAKYEICSNAKINNEKSKLICFSLTTILLLQKTHPFIPNNPSNSFIFLGINIKNLKYDYYLTWNNISTFIQNKINTLSTRNLSIKGRVLVSKSLILSKIWYYSIIIPPNYKTKKNITSIINKFIRNSPLLPSYQKLCAPLSMGGVAAPDWNISLTALLSKQFINLLTSKAFWAGNARKMLEYKTKLQPNKKIDLYQALNNINEVYGWPRKWIPWIKA